MKPGMIVILLLVAIAVVVLIYNIGWNNGMPAGEPPAANAPAEPIAPAQ